MKCCIALLNIFSAYVVFPVKLPKSKRTKSFVVKFGKISFHIWNLFSISSLSNALKLYASSLIFLNGNTQLSSSNSWISYFSVKKIKIYTIGGDCLNSSNMMNRPAISSSMPSIPGVVVPTARMLRWTAAITRSHINNLHDNKIWNHGLICI